LLLQDGILNYHIHPGVGLARDESRSANVEPLPAYSMPPLRMRPWRISCGTPPVLKSVWLIQTGGCRRMNFLTANLNDKISLFLLHMTSNSALLSKMKLFLNNFTPFLAFYTLSQLDQLCEKLQ
jgi:hypothetical protein